MTSRAEALAKALEEILRCDAEAANAKGKQSANLNGLGLVDLFDSVGHPFGVGPHGQAAYRSCDLDAAVQGARAALEAYRSQQDGWVSVNDRLPSPDGDDVFVWHGFGEFMSADVAAFDSGGFFGLWSESGPKTLGDVTHWMQIPAAPYTITPRDSKDAALTDLECPPDPATVDAAMKPNSKEQQ